MCVLNGIYVLQGGGSPPCLKQKHTKKEREGLGAGDGSNQGEGSRGTPTRGRRKRGEHSSESPQGGLSHLSLPEKLADKLKKEGKNKKE